MEVFGIFLNFRVCLVTNNCILSRAGEELKALCQQVLELIKKEVGLETFTKQYAESHKHLTDRREVRKQQKAAEVNVILARCQVSQQPQFFPSWYAKVCGACKRKQTKNTFGSVSDISLTVLFAGCDKSRNRSKKEN